MKTRKKILKDRDAKQLAEAIVYDADLDIQVVAVRIEYDRVLIRINNIWNSWKQRDEFKRLITPEFDKAVVVVEWQAGAWRSTSRLVSYNGG